MEPPPTHLGRFRVLAEIGRGGMGRVYEAHDPSLDRRVAIKTVWSGPGTAPPDVESFLAEARHTARLEHPGIIPVHEVGRTDAGEVFFVMRRVAGLTLREVLDRLDRDGVDEAPGGWTRGRLLPAFIQVCRAVAFAHDAGVLHRDLKPDNLMLGRYGEVYVLDWGVARRMGAPAEVRRDARSYAADGETVFAETVGTPGYMSPEQAQGQLVTLDARSDVWSLGAILFEILTGKRALASGAAHAMVFAALSGRAPDPVAEAPERRIPESVARVCRVALSPAPADRFLSAEALARALEEHLEGARRAAEADAQVARGQAEWARFGELSTELQALRARRDALGDGAAPWVPLADRPELVAVRTQLQSITPEHAAAFASTVAACEAALAHDPEHAGAHALLAEAYWDRFQDAEATQDGLALAYFEGRVRHHGGAKYEARLDGAGRLTLITDPPGADVLCREFDRHGLVWPLGPERRLGVTPLLDVPMAMGSYRLTLRTEDAEVTYPVFLERNGAWRAEGVPLVQPGPGLVYVPGGPTLTGGDPDASLPEPRRWRDVPGFLLRTHPVTCGEWCEYLNALAEVDPDAAFAKVPRLDAGERQQAELWPRQERYTAPILDRDGDAWQPDWPISGIHWQDARDYAAWRAERDGEPWRLPTEAEWEKAARGVDGRFLPWGDEFHPSLCKMRRSRAGRANPEAVGAFPNDVSVYGVADLAGTIREWCGDEAFDGRDTERPVKGGSWGSEPRTCRAATRMGLEPWYVVTTYGFRLAQDLPTV